MLATQTDLHPSAFSLQPSDALAGLSLAELRAVRAAWLLDAEQRGAIQTVIDVTRELGRPYVIRDRKSCFARLLELDYASETIHALYYEYNDAWLTFQCAYSWRKSIVVSIGRAEWWQAPRALVYTQTNRPYLNRDDFLFVPGDWITPFLFQSRSAQELAVARYQDATERQRAALLAQLTLQSP